jgi:hypothetical protein
MRNVDLRNAAKITEEDVSANKEGTLGPQQRKKLHQIWLNLLGIGVIAFSLELFVVLITWLTNYFNQPPNRLGVFIYPAIAVILLVILVFDLIRIRADLKSGKVEQLEGTLTRPIVMYPFSLLSLLRFGGIAVQGISLKVPRNVHAQIVFGKHYRAYFAPRSRILLAIERLR